MRRTAILVHVGTFGRDGRAGDLEYETEVAELAQQLREYKFDVRELTGDETAGAAIWPAIKRVIDDHDRSDVVVVHILSHGYDDEDRVRLTVAGRDLVAPGGSEQLAENADVVDWLGYLGNPARPYVLLLLDLCYAGNVVRAEEALRITEPNKLWLLAAATRVAYDARLTRAAAAALSQINAADTDGARLRGFGPYVPLRTFAIQVRENLAALVGTGFPQEMIGSQASITVNDGLLPFFPNLNPVGVPTPRLADSFPTIEGIDDAPELAYFVAAIRCHAAGDRSPIAFTGRKVERDAILGWLTDHSAARVALVTGRAGTGKSALLGAIVCATHPVLAPKLGELGIGRLAAPKSLLQTHSAVLSARGQDSGALAAEIGRQLLGARDIRSADLLLRRLATTDRPCFVVVDALDEAVDPTSVVDDLIVPLARLAAPAVKLLVSARPGGSADHLPPLTSIDLNLVEPEELVDDLELYARRLLGTHPGYQGDEQVQDVRNRLAVTIARTLTKASNRLELGEFLVTRLYVEWLIQRQIVARNTDEADERGREVPLGLPELFEKDMQLLADREWVRPVLAALAHDVGYGMPAALIPKIIAARSGRAPTDREVAATLDSVGRYVTVLPSPDGAAYRLFHDALTEHLRHDADTGTLFDALIRSVPITAGDRDWTRATWYARRHILHCAPTADDLAAVLLDIGYLLTDAPEIRTAITDLGPSRLADAARAVVDLATGWPRPLTGTQRSLLTIAAVRAECPELAERLSTGRLRPVHVTGRAAPGAHHRERTVPEFFAIGDEPPIVAHCVALPRLRVLFTLALPDLIVIGTDSYRGEPEIVTQGPNWPVEFRAAADPDQVHLSLEFDQPITAAIRAGDTVVASTWRGELREWQRGHTALNGEPFYELTFVTTPDGEPRLVGRQSDSLVVLANNRVHHTGWWTDGAGMHTVVEIDGCARIIFCTDSGETFLIDPVDGRAEAGPAWTGRDISAIVAVPSQPRPCVVVGDTDGALWKWECGTEEWQPLGSSDDMVTALISYHLDGQWFVGSATDTGEVAAWNLATRAADKVQVGFPVRFLVSRFAEITDVGPTPVAVAAGFNGLVLAEPIDAMTVATQWVPFAGGAGDRGRVQVDRPATDFSLAQCPGWTVLVAKHGTRDRSFWHPVTGQSLSGATRFITDRGHPEQLVPLSDRVAEVYGTEHGDLYASADDDSPPILAHFGAVTAVAAWQHGDIPLAATCGADQTLRIWDLVARWMIAETWLPAPASQVTVVADNTGGYRIVAVTDDDIIVFAFTPEGDRR